MRSAIWASLALVTATAALSGCIEGDQAVAQVGGGPNSTPIFGQDTGAIRGLILTEEELPIADAVAGIILLGVHARTDGNGLFALNNLPPGDYIVQVSALGYQPSSQSVVVEAGKATDLVNFRLAQDLSDSPYYRTLIYNAQLSGVMWKLTPTCVYTDQPLVKTCGGVRFGEASLAGNNVTAGCDVCETHTMGDDFGLFNSNWQTLLGEVDWRAQSGATGKGYLFDINAPNITRGTNGAISQSDPYTFQSASNKAPLAVRVDKDGLAGRGIKESDWNNPTNPASCRANTDTDPELENRTNCDWFFRLFPAAYDLGIGEDGFGPDYGVMLESTATVYFTYFIREKAAPDFSALV